MMTATNKLKSEHTKRERYLIKKFGGTPRISYGYDGTINGKPVEVRSARVDKRFRIQRDVHETLLRRNGFYIFDALGHRPVKISAQKVSKKLNGSRWLKDRKYPHRFVLVKNIW